MAYECYEGLQVKLLKGSDKKMLSRAQLAWLITKGLPRNPLSVVSGCFPRQVTPFDWLAFAITVAEFKARAAGAHFSSVYKYCI